MTRERSSLIFAWLFLLLTAGCGGSSNEPPEVKTDGLTEEQKASIKKQDEQIQQQESQR